MILYDKDLNLIGDISSIIGKDIEIRKTINSPNFLKFTAYDLSNIYQEIKGKRIIEIEDDYYLIESVKKIRIKGVHLEVTAYQILTELETEYWENSFEVAFTYTWEPLSRIVRGLYYTHLGIDYVCTESHVSLETFDPSKFTSIEGLENNFMPDTTPQFVLERLLQNTSWTVGTCDAFTSTDFSLSRGSIYRNLQSMIRNWGGELEINKRTIRLKHRIGSDTFEDVKRAENISDITIDEDNSTIINKLYVYGNSGLTFESLTGFKYVKDDTSIAEYGQRTSELQLTSINDVSFLLLRANEELEKMKSPSINVSSKTLKLDSQAFDIGDTVKVSDYGLGLTESEYRIISLSYNPFKQKIYDMQLGKTALSIASILKKQKQDSDLGDKELSDRIDNIQNDEVVISRVIDVVQQETVSVENAHIMNAWIQNLFVDRIETNTWGRDIRNPELQALIGVETEHFRNYITVQEQYINFITETIELDFVETLKIPNPDPLLDNEVTVYYTAINDDAQAYKYYTITPPNVLNPLILPSQNHLYEVKVFRVKEISGIKQRASKMRISFTEGAIQEVELLMGAGDGIGELTNKFRVFKGTNTTELYYYNSSSLPNGLLIKLTHTEVRNTNPPSGGGHVANVYYGTSDPSPGLGQNGDLFFKII